MKGSEKQIAWAQDLKTNVIRCIDAVVDANVNCPPELHEQYKDQIEKLVSMWNGRKAKLEACDSAAAIIDYFRPFKASGNLQTDVYSVMGIYNVTPNNGYEFREEK